MSLEPAIERSWRRSVTLRAPLGSGPTHYIGDIDRSEPLLRAAEPVLDSWQEDLDGLRVALFLSDRTGRIIAHRVVEPGDLRRLDRAYAPEGFDFSENSFGTNGLGTVLEGGSLVFVRGAEHFNDSLQSLSCAGAPIRDISGRVVGALAIAATASAASKLMLPVARQVARSIGDQLAEQMLPPHLRPVLAQILATSTGRSLLILTRQGVFSSTGTAAFASGDAHVLLWEYLQSHDWRDGPHVITLAGVHGHARRLGTDGTDVAYVIELDDPPSAEPRSLDLDIDHDRNLSARLEILSARTGAVSLTG